MAGLVRDKLHGNLEPVIKLPVVGDTCKLIEILTFTHLKNTQSRAGQKAAFPSKELHSWSGNTELHPPLRKGLVR